ncbi:sporulation protein YqfD [Tuberibacillus sp. Marseille-P3662]|uniref:sporulation protein YqfD n=1 Tax=Tuberibacillus sp. Marseille-P3662 TaxID=1965358 RepID=UPI000A1CC72E|nr:sporulation protein YqfD [Tuberibacillus sp. Marseille-P3662]
MKKNWDETIYGHVRVIIKGKRTEQFINRCVRENVAIWDVSRVTDNKIRCYIALKNVKEIKPLLKATDCRIHFERRQGLPFFIKRMTNRAGIIGGLALFFLVLFILSNMVWSIKITGADARVEDDINKILKNMQVHVGSIDFFLPPLEKMEDELAAQLDKVTWVGVSKNGTTYRIDVVQKELPKEDKNTGPRDMVASQKATIVDIYAEKGTPMVKVNDFVKPGDVLISGNVGTSEDPKFVSAKGKVIGETWMTTETEVPLKTDYTTMTGETYTQHQLSLFGWDVPIWGFDDDPYKHSEKEVVKKPVRFLFWKLPVSYKKEIKRETESSKRHLSKSDAVKLGKNISRKQLLNRLSDEAEIVSQEATNIDQKDGIVKLEISYTVHQKITETKSFVPKQRKQKLEEETEDDE